MQPAFEVFLGQRGFLKQVWSVEGPPHNLQDFVPVRTAHLQGSSGVHVLTGQGKTGEHDMHSTVHYTFASYSLMFYTTHDLPLLSGYDG